MIVPWLDRKVWGWSDFVAQSIWPGFTPNDTGEHCCASSVLTIGRSGSPVAAPAWSLQAIMSSTFWRKSAAVPTIAKSWEHAVMIAFRASLLLRCESMKSCRWRRP